MVILTPELRRAIAAEAEATYPDECVGLLLGQLDGETKQAVATFPVKNTWEGQMVLSETDNPTSRRDRFYLDPKDYLRADREAQARGLDVIGCYHSHPDHPAEPSERDRVGAQGIAGPSFAFLIQSVRAGQAVELRSWTLVEQGTRFEPELIETTDRDA